MADATMTIAVKVRDEATKALTSLSGRVKSALGSPFAFVGKQLQIMVKSLLSFRAILTGGGLVFAINKAFDVLAKNAKTFESVFSSGAQSRIDAAATAWDKFGTSIKTTFGNVVADLGLDKIFDGMSDWLRDNQDKVLAFFKGLVSDLKSVAAAIGAIGSEIKRLPTPEIDKAVARRAAEAAGGSLTGSGTGNYAGLLEGSLNFGATGPRQPTPEEILRTSFPPGTFGLPPGWDAVVNPQTAAAIETVAKATTSAAESTNDLTKANELVTLSFEDFQKTLSTHQGTLTQLDERYKTVRLDIEEVADTVAGNFTDAFFDAIEGTKSFARAFADMTVSILRDIGRLLVFRSIFNLVAGGISGAISGPNAGNIGGAGEAGGTFGSGFEGPYGNAVGTSFSRGGSVMVGERGPERVSLPRGAHVARTDQSGGGGGGITINVIGARDAKATAAEVIRELEKHGGLRASVKAVARS